MNQFWSRWHNEYLIPLREQNNREHKGPRLQNNDVLQLNQIILIENLLPQNMWKLGKIIKFSNPHSTIIRNVQLLMLNKRIIYRPVNRIYPLEIAPISKHAETLKKISSPAAI